MIVVDATGPPRAKRIKLNKDSDDEDSDFEDMEVEAGASGGEAAKANSATTEQVAAEARASKSLEERHQEFKAMLLERGVSLMFYFLCYPPKYTPSSLSSLLSSHDPLFHWSLSFHQSLL